MDPVSTTLSSLTGLMALWTTSVKLGQAKDDIRYFMRKVEDLKSLAIELRNKRIGLQNMPTTTGRQDALCRVLQLEKNVWTTLSRLDDRVLSSLKGCKETQSWKADKNEEDAHQTRAERALRNIQWVFEVNTGAKSLEPDLRHFSMMAMLDALFNFAHNGHADGQPLPTKQSHRQTMPVPSAEDALREAFELIGDTERQG